MCVQNIYVCVYKSLSQTVSLPRNYEDSRHMYTYEYECMHIYIFGCMNICRTFYIQFLWVYRPSEDRPRTPRLYTQEPWRDICEGVSQSRTVSLNLSCTFKSPGALWKIFMPGPLPKPSQSDSLGITTFFFFLQVFQVILTCTLWQEPLQSRRKLSKDRSNLKTKSGSVTGALRSLRPRYRSFCFWCRWGCAIDTRVSLGKCSAYSQGEKMNIHGT